jgi:hypothetical protein|tara:strand:- start:3 stop:179 length:177 start_codon:yes stop_codon:yes gene_type:complete
MINEKNFNLKDHIENLGITRNKFAVNNNISPELVYYWCSKPFYKLGYNTKERIKKIIL